MSVLIDCLRRALPARIDIKYGYYTDEDYAHADGWNDCLAEIEKNIERFSKCAIVVYSVRSGKAGVLAEVNSLEKAKELLKHFKNRGFDNVEIYVEEVAHVYNNGEVSVRAGTLCQLNSF